MAEPHRESTRKGVASFKAGAEPVDSAEEIEQLVVTFNVAMGEIVKVEKVDKAGKSQELTEEECAKLAGQDEVEEIEAALEEAFEAGVAVVLGDEDEEYAQDDDNEERAIRQLLIGELLGRHPVRRRLLRRLLLRRLLNVGFASKKRESFVKEARKRSALPLDLRLSGSFDRRSGNNGQFEGSR